MTKDITTSNSHAYVYRLDESATAENGMKWNRTEGKRLRDGIRMGNFEIREGFEAPEIAPVIRDLGEIAHRICPWVEFVAAPEIVGFARGAEVFVEGATVATNKRNDVAWLSYPARVESILFSTGTDMRDAHEVLFRACWQAIEREAAFGWGEHAKPYFEQIDASLAKDADPDLRRLATSDKDGRRKAFGAWAKAQHLFPSAGEDFLDDHDDAPFYVREFHKAFAGVTGADLFAKHNPYAHTLKVAAELAGEAA
jgi:hypothetical protein